MAEFEQLQHLWQAQRSPLLTAMEAAPLSEALRRFSRRQHWIIAFKVLLVGGILGQAFYQLANRSAGTIGGLVLVGAGSLWAVIADWRGQRAISRLNFAEPSAAFLRTAIEKIRRQWDPFGPHYWPFLACMVAGMNLMFLDSMQSKTPVMRLLWHSFGTALPFAGYEIGLRLRRRRFEVQCRPLLDRLIDMKAGLEEPPQ
jgi:hypothetical protein